MLRELSLKDFYAKLYEVCREACEGNTFHVTHHRTIVAVLSEGLDPAVRLAYTPITVGLLKEEGAHIMPLVSVGAVFRVDYARIGQYAWLYRHPSFSHPLESQLTEVLMTAALARHALSRKSA